MTNPTPEPGDRIRVTYEGVYRLAPDGGVIDLSGDGESYGALPVDLDVAAAVEILPPPEPPVGTVIIGYDRETTRASRDQWVFERVAGETEHGWRTTGVGNWYSYEQVLEHARYNRKIIEP